MDDSIIRKRKLRNEAAKKLEKKIKLEYSKTILDEISQDPKLFYELLDDLDVLEQDLFDSLSGKKERNISFYDQALVSVKEKKLKKKKSK